MVADMEVADKVAHMVDNWTFDQSDEETWPAQQRHLENILIEQSQSQSA